MSCRVGRVERVKHAKTPQAIALTFTRSLAFSLAHEINTCLARHASVRGRQARDSSEKRFKSPRRSPA